MTAKFFQHALNPELCTFASLRAKSLHVVAAVVLGIVNYEAAAEEPVFGPMLCDPAEVVGAEECAKCHQAEVAQWMRTPHHATFDTLHRQPEAKAIADRLGLRSIKRNETCLQCHYTEQDQDGRVRVVAGVSCESCHGAAADWIAVHADYGGLNVTQEMETAEHRTERFRASIAQGMNNPHNVYLIARECYNCHTVPDEQLVNVGGHIAGSQDFELVSWSQGAVRHNFLRGGGTANVAGTPAGLRVMYVVGVMTDLEYSLRAVAAATTKANFGVASAERAVRMKRRLQRIQYLVQDPLIEPALAAVSTVELRLNNRAAILAAADEIGQAALKFADEANGNNLAPIDALLPLPNRYKN